MHNKVKSATYTNPTPENASAVWHPHKPEDTQQPEKVQHPAAGYVFSNYTDDHLVASHPRWRNWNGQAWKNEGGTYDAGCSTTLTTTSWTSTQQSSSTTQLPGQEEQSACISSRHDTQLYSTSPSPLLYQIGTISPVSII